MTSEQELEHVLADTLIEYKDARQTPSQDEFIESVSSKLSEPPVEGETMRIAEYYHIHFE